MELEKRIERVEIAIIDALAQVDKHEITHKKRQEERWAAYDRHYRIVTTLEVLGIWVIALALWFDA